jgi:1-phosphofructokinase
MIVTVTPNPSIDRTIHVPRLARGELNRTSAPVSEAAGKGLNVSRALRLHGVETIAVLPLAADSAATYLGFLADEVRVASVRVRGSVRTNLSIVETDGTVTKLNEPGPEMGALEAEALLELAGSIESSWIVGCGSLPPGAHVSFYARLAALATPERRIAVDASGVALRACLASEIAVIKPNLGELEEQVEARLETIGQVINAAQALLGAVSAVLVSLGADGALYVDRSHVVHAEARVERVVNTIGAGDALLAGFLAAGGGASAVGTAVAWATAAVATPSTGMRPVAATDLAAVRVSGAPDRTRRVGRDLVAVR